MSLTTVIINWHGPYSLEDVYHSNEGDGIYLLVGKTPYQKKPARVQYCGITEDLFCNRISNQHHKVSRIRKDTLSIWLGKITYPKRFTRRHLEIAEHSIVYFWYPKLNETKNVYCPRKPVCCISQWFTTDESPRLRRPAFMGNRPDILWWDTKQWRSGKLKVWREGEEPPLPED